MSKADRKEMGEPKFDRKAEPRPVNQCHGTVLDPDGEPVAGVDICYADNQGSIMASCKSDDEGHYQFVVRSDFIGNENDFQRFNLWAKKDGFQIRGQPLSNWNEIGDGGIEIKLHKAVAPIRFRVLRSDGLPATAEDVKELRCVYSCRYTGNTVSSRNATEKSIVPRASDLHRRWCRRIPQLLPDSDCRFQLDHDSFGQHRISIGSTELGTLSADTTFKLAGTGSLEVSVDTSVHELPEGLLFAFLPIGFASKTSTAGVRGTFPTEGKISVDAMPAGKYRLCLLAPAKRRTTKKAAVTRMVTAAICFFSFQRSKKILVIQVCDQSERKSASKTSFTALVPNAPHNP